MTVCDNYLNSNIEPKVHLENDRAIQNSSGLDLCRFES